MMVFSRPYRDSSDLERLNTFLSECRSAIDQSHYLHRGDLTWQLFHMLADHHPSDLLRIWEDQDGVVRGFVLVYPGLGFFDVNVHPASRGTVLEDEMIAWALGYFHTLGAEQLFTFAHEHDHGRCSRLERAGFERGSSWLYLQHPLGQALQSTAPPDGIVIRAVSGEDEVDERARVLAAAFGADGAVQTERYLRFMRSPGYVRDLDLVAVLPNGAFRAFAMGWVDPASRVGQFEPVGTDPRMRRRGLASSVLQEGLRRMQDFAVEQVIVVVDAGEPAVELYRSVGFTPLWTLYLYEKIVIGNTESV